MKLHIDYYCNDVLHTIDNDTSRNITSLDDNLGLLFEEDERHIRLKLYPEKEIRIENISLEYPYEFKADDRIFFNGYQGWSHSHEDGIYTKKAGFNSLPFFKRIMLKKFYLDRYGDYDFAEYPNRPGYNHSWSYIYIRRGENYHLLGSLNEDLAFTRFVYELKKSSLTIIPDLKGYVTSRSFVAIDLCVLEGSEDEVFDGWFRLMGIEKPKASPLRGYTSWYNHYQDINENSIAKDLRGIDCLPVRTDVFQIDDGWEKKIGDWLSADEAKFPEGLRPIVDRIHEKDMLAGLWLAPFSAEKDSLIYREHPDWIIKDKNGEDYCCGCNWSNFYGLDIYNEEVREYLRKVFDTVFSEWGFDLVKLDFLYCACVLNRPDRPRGQIMADGMKFLRDLCKDKLILGCGVPLASAFGRVDYCRVGCDVSLEYDDVFYMRRAHPERTSTKHCTINTVFRRQLDGRAFLNDPDVFILRDENVKMSEKQKEDLAVINGLFGSVLFMSDDASQYDEKKMELYRKIGTLKGKARSVDFINNEAIIIYDDEGTEKEIRITK